MKVTQSVLTKKGIISVFSFILTFTINTASAQTDDTAKSIITDYQNRVGDFTPIYNGEVEPTYSPTFYKNTPYYISEEFSNGDIGYKGRRYFNLQMRLDLNRDQLITITPEGKYAMIVNKNGVEWAYVHGRKVINHTPAAKSGLKPGYYIEHFKGDRLSLLEKTVFTLNRSHAREIPSFDRRTRYYILMDGNYHQVSNRSSFTRLFPLLKKEIKSFSKEKGLDFKRHTESSLTQLASQCDMWIKQMNNQ